VQNNTIRQVATREDSAIEFDCKHPGTTGRPQIVGQQDGMACPGWIGDQLTGARHPEVFRECGPGRRGNKECNNQWPGRVSQTGHYNSLRTDCHQMPPSIKAAVDLPCPRDEG